MRHVTYERVLSQLEFHFGRRFRLINLDGPLALAEQGRRGELDLDVLVGRHHDVLNVDKLV